jgi:addiction module HigA family antidote
MSRELPDPTGPIAPPHPGLLLRDRVLPALEITVSQAALDLATTRQTLHSILAGRTAITTDMAVRLEQFCGVPASFWLLRQQEHDLAQARKALTRSLKEICCHPLPNAVLVQIGAHLER